MSPDEVVTHRLLDSEVSRVQETLAGKIATSHAELSGKIDVLAQAQHDQVAAQDLASRLSSEEHARVQQGLAAMGAKIDGLILNQRTDDAAQAAVEKWRRRAIGAVVTTITLLIGAATVFVSGPH